MDRNLHLSASSPPSGGASPAAGRRVYAVVAFLALLTLLGVPMAEGTSYVAMSDGELAQAAETVAVVQVLEGGAPGPAGTLPTTDYLVMVEEVLKGSLSEPRIRLRVPGGVNADGFGWRAFGAPAFAAGDRLIAFLTPRPDGTWGLEQFALGAFVERRVGHDALALRDLSGMKEVAGHDATRPKPETEQRSFAGFTAWLRDLGNGKVRSQDYRVESGLETDEGYSMVSSPFTYLDAQCSGVGLPARWFSFDEGGAVSWKIGEGGQLGMSGSSPPGRAEFQNALEVWNDDAGSNVRLPYDGTTKDTLPTSDDTGVIAFDDPDGEISGSFSGSGVLAIGGPYYRCEARLYEAQEFRPAVMGFIVTQDGAGSYFGSAGGANGEEVFAHEVGHTLGFGHTVESGALMRASTYGDGRGAFLGSDERAALSATYGSDVLGGEAPGTEAEPPAAPSDLTALPWSQQEMDLEWVDNSTDETLFQVEIASGSFSPFQILGETAANVTGGRIEGLLPDTTYRFRVKACNGAGCSLPSNIASATTLGEPSSAGSPPAAPDRLEGEVLSSTQVELTWRDNSQDEDHFYIERALDAGAFTQVGRVDSDVRRVTVGSLIADTGYRFRVRAGNAFGFSAYSRELTLETPSELPPECSEPGVLCLQNGRFAVDVSWKNQHAGGATGSGRPIPGTEKTGMFWFFNRDNVELVVKILDGRLINGHFWVFYGGLSDVEYDVRVRDLVSGQERIFHNQPGMLCGRGDTTAIGPFDENAASVHLTATGVGPRLIPWPADAPPQGAALVTGGACSPATDRLCLGDGRFEVSVGWTNQHAGESGTGQVMSSAVGGDKTGFFWFFNQANVELVVKMIDGRSVNGHHWFFYGALSDVEYEITLRDTLTDEVRTYSNEAGSICGRSDTAAF